MQRKEVGADLGYARVASSVLKAKKSVDTDEQPDVPQEHGSEADGSHQDIDQGGSQSTSQQSVSPEGVEYNSSTTESASSCENQLRQHKRTKFERAESACVDTSATNTASDEEVVTQHEWRK